MTNGFKIWVLACAFACIAQGIQNDEEKWKPPAIRITYSNPLLPQDKQPEFLNGFVNYARISPDKVTIKFHVPKPPLPPQKWHPGYWLKQGWKTAAFWRRNYVEQSITLVGNEAKTVYSILTEPSLFIPVEMDSIQNGAESDLPPSSGGVALSKANSLYFKITASSLSKKAAPTIEQAEAHVHFFYPELSGIEDAPITSQRTSSHAIPLAEISPDALVNPLNYYNKVAGFHQFGVPRPDGLVAPLYAVSFDSEGNVVGLMKQDIEGAEAGAEIPVYRFPIETLRLAYDSEHLLGKWEALTTEKDRIIQQRRRQAELDILAERKIGLGRFKQLKSFEHWDKIISPDQGRVGTFILPKSMKQLPAIPHALVILREEILKVLPEKVTPVERSNPGVFSFASKRCNAIIATFRAYRGN